MLEIAIVVLAAVLGPGQPERPRLVARSSGCGFRVGAPATWALRPVKSQRKGECEVHLVPPTTERIPDWCGQSTDCFAIRIRSRVGDERTACEQYGVCKDERGSWYFSGSSGGGPPAIARRIASSLLIEGTRETRLSGEFGRATVEALDAMLIGRDRVAEIDANTGEGMEFHDETLFTAIVESFRFQ